MWRAGDLVSDIAKEIGKEPQAIYGYARDNRERFPKRTRGARKKKRDPEDIVVFDPVPIEEMVIVPSRAIKSVRQSIAIFERLARNAEKMGQPRAAEDYRRAAALNRRELAILKEADNG